MSFLAAHILDTIGIIMLMTWGVNINQDTQIMVYVVAVIWGASEGIYKPQTLGKTLLINIH